MAGFGFSDPIPGEPPGGATEEEAAALAKLRPLVAADCWPLLSDARLLEVLRDSRRWKFWTPNAAVSLGELVSATPYSGVGWRCVKAGVTGAAAPPQFALILSVEDADMHDIIADNTAFWQCTRAINKSPFDIRKAAHVCWTEKAAKTYLEHNHSPGGNRRFDRESIHAHCLKMAAKFAPIRAA